MWWRVWIVEVKINTHVKPNSSGVAVENFFVLVWVLTVDIMLTKMNDSRNQDDYMLGHDDIEQHCSIP